MTISLQVIKANNSLRNQYHYSNRVSNEETKIKKNRRISFKKNKIKRVLTLQNGSVSDICLVSLSSRNISCFLAVPALVQIRLNNLLREISYMLTLLAWKKELFDEPLLLRDSMAWQNELFAGEDAETGREYWRNQNISSSFARQLSCSMKAVCRKPIFKPQIYQFLDLDPDIVIWRRIGA